jgi:hypothetical protein
MSDQNDTFEVVCCKPHRIVRLKVVDADLKSIEEMAQKCDERIEHFSQAICGHGIERVEVI